MICVSMDAMGTAAQPATDRSRANTLATLGFAALTLASLAVPWPACHNENYLSVVWWLSIGLIVLSSLRLVVPAVRLAWLSLSAATALVISAVLAAFQCLDAFVPTTRAGPVVTATAALLCAIAAGRGPAAQRARAGTRP
jgi:nitric oxide reductase large subunit